jgi:hypothetical protein
MTDRIFDPSTWTWNCMVCGDLRPDAKISVRVREVQYQGEIMPGGAYNQKYCNDRQACIAAAAKPGPYVLDASKP